MFFYKIETAINQLINQSIIQSTNQSINQSINQYYKTEFSHLMTGATSMLSERLALISPYLLLTMHL
jgi:hypothetical protein